jgi:hypothetical protein
MCCDSNLESVFPHFYSATCHQCLQRDPDVPQQVITIFLEDDYTATASLKRVLVPSGENAKEP